MESVMASAMTLLATTEVVTTNISSPSALFYFPKTMANCSLPKNFEQLAISH
jgi:hypothetical protein